MLNNNTGGLASLCPGVIAKTAATACGNVGDVSRLVALRGGLDAGLLKAAALFCFSLKIDSEIPHEDRHRFATDCGQGENSQTSPSEIEASTISTSPQLQSPW